MRGLAIAPRLRRRAPEARILLLTADDLEYDVHDVPAVDAYLRKIDIERLLPAAQELLGLPPLTG